MPITALLVIHVVWKLTVQITYSPSPAWIQGVTALHKTQITETAHLLTASSQTTFSGGFCSLSLTRRSALDSARGLGPKNHLNLTLHSFTLLRCNGMQNIAFVICNILHSADLILNYINIGVINL